MSLRIDKVLPQGARGGHGVRANPNAFGAQEAQAQMNRAQAVERTGMQVSAVFEQRHKERYEAEMLEKQMAYSDALMAFDADYRNTRQGKSAITAKDDYDAEQQRLIAEMGGSFGDQKKALDFQKRVYTQTRSFMSNGISYGIAQDNAYKGDQVNALYARSMEEIAKHETGQEKAAEIWNNYRNAVSLIQPNRSELQIVKDEQGFKAARKEGVIQQFAVSPDSGLMLVNAALGIEPKNLPKEEQEYMRSRAKEVRELFSNTELLTLKKQAQAGQEINETKVIQGLFTNFKKSLGSVPYEQMDEHFYQWAAQYPQNERKKLVALFKDEKNFIKEARDAQDAGIVSRFIQSQSEAKTSPAWMKNLATTHANDLAAEGLSPDGFKMLNKAIENRDIETEQNLTARSTLLSKIDTGQIKSDEDIDAFGFSHGMTLKQIDETKKYRAEGGQEGFLWKSYSEIDKTLKFYGKNKGLKENPAFFESVRKAMEGKPATEAVLRETVRELLVMDYSGERNGGGTAVGYGKDMSYAEALAAGAGEDWLPDVPSDEEKRIKDEMRMLYSVTGLNRNDVRWIRRRELGLPVPTDKLPRGYK